MMIQTLGTPPDLIINNNNNITNNNNNITTFIQKVLLQYQQKLEQDGQFSQYENNQLIQQQIDEKVKYYGYQDKKSITIKPINKHKDLIALKKQNQQKRNIIKQLQKMNKQLKQQYHQSMKQNYNVERFLKDIDFTFKNDKKTQKANQIMLKAKRTLYRQALQCKNSAKKITKSSQANKVQQIKIYIQFLQSQKKKIKKLIQSKIQSNQKLRQQQDFNQQNQAKFQQTMQYIEQMLNVQMKKCKRHHQIYKIQQGMVSTGLKQKQIQLKKKQIQKNYQQLKDLKLKQQGEQYQIIVLQKKRKDKVKILQQNKQFKIDMINKHKNIQLLEKQLKQKLKTYDYMSKWTKQLKVKLQQKKQNHINNKIIYQQKINTLSRQFEQWNKKYKLQLVQQQVMKKKNTNNKQIYMIRGDNMNKQGNRNNLGKKVRIVRIWQISKIVKKLKLWLIEEQIDVDQFLKDKVFKWKIKEDEMKSMTNIGGFNPNSSINNLGSNHKNMLKNITSKKNLQLNNNNNKINNNNNNNIKDPSLSSQPIKQLKITLQQILLNLKQIQILQQYPQSQVFKLARYIVQDNNGNFSKIDNNISISMNLAYTIFKKLLQTQLKNKKIMKETKKKLKEFLNKYYDSFRYDLLKQLLVGVNLVEKNYKIIEQTNNNNLDNYNNNSSSMNSNQFSMRRNQQLHLHLQLDSIILQRTIKKHIYQQYSVILFKQYIEFMIWRQFRQVQQPKLGMFDKICQIILKKKIIKQNMAKQFITQSEKNKNIFDYLSSQNQQEINQLNQKQHSQQQIHKQCQKQHQNQEQHKQQHQNQEQQQNIFKNSNNTKSILIPNQQQTININNNQSYIINNFNRQSDKKKKRTWLDGLVDDNSSDQQEYKNFNLSDHEQNQQQQQQQQ